jgi:hypothetical protein
MLLNHAKESGHTGMEAWSYKNSKSQEKYAQIFEEICVRNSQQV